VRVAETARSNRYLSLLERQRIATLRRQGVGVREIARRTGRAASTVSRELRRNVLRHDYNIYDADLAHARARQRARRQRRTRLIRDPELRRLVQAKLELEWSPDRSRPTCAPRTPNAATGICATRPSTKASTTAGKVV
jgi:IS30 family transposase